MLPRIADIASGIADTFRVSRRDLMGAARFKHIVHARKALYLAAHMEGHAYAAIGRVLGRDHSTVIYGCNSARWFYENDELYREAISSARVLAREPFRKQLVEVRPYVEQLAQKAAKPDLDDIELADAGHLGAMKHGSEALLQALAAA